MKSKKGALPFNFLVVIGFTAIMIYAWIELSSKYGSFDRQIGEKQFELIKSYQYGEMALFYTDKSAEYAAHESIYELAYNGGHISESGAECGKLAGSNVWYEVRRADSGFEAHGCFDETKLEENFVLVFNETLNNYFANNPYGLKNGNYNYNVEDNYITGTAKAPIKIDINITK